jgi:hypothetical protein
MIERKKHLREVIKTKSKQIENRDKLVDGQRAEIHQWQKENEVLHQENQELRFDNEELRELFNKIKNLVEINNYNNEKIILAKIKELVCDYQSKN